MKNRALVVLLPLLLTSLSGCKSNTKNKEAFDDTRDDYYKNIELRNAFNKESGETICKAPCSKKFPKKEDGVIVLGFEYEDYSIEPMTVTLDKDMIVNLNLKQETENE